MTRILRLVAMVLLGLTTVFAQDELSRVESAITSIKGHNFRVLNLGVLANSGLSERDLSALRKIQTAPPRQMRVLVTQSDFVGDVYRDFTFLTREKQVNAVLVWPSDLGSNPKFQKKICQMSKRMKIPVIALQPGWVEQGAILQFIEEKGSTTVHVNEKSCEIMHYSVPAEIQAIRLAMN